MFGTWEGWLSSNYTTINRFFLFWWLNEGKSPTADHQRRLVGGWNAHCLGALPLPLPTDQMPSMYHYPCRRYNQKTRKNEKTMDGAVPEWLESHITTNNWDFNLFQLTHLRYFSLNIEKSQQAVMCKLLLKKGDGFLGHEFLCTNSDDRWTHDRNLDT